MKIKTTKTTFSLTALMLLAVAALTPACDIYNPDPCDPEVEICPFTGGNPSGLNN